MRPRDAVRAAAALALALSALPGRSAAQGTRIDAGAYSIRIGGRQVGREDFEIRREGNLYQAVGRVSLDSAPAPFASLQVRLQTDSVFRPDLFDLRFRDGGGSVRAVQTGRRLRLFTSTAEGERVKEFLARPRLVILQPGVAHEYYFLLKQLTDAEGGSGSVTVIVPGQDREVEASGSLVGREELPIGDSTVRAAHYRLTVGGDARELWVDADGRVLKVTDPSRSWTATRQPEKSR